MSDYVPCEVRWQAIVDAGGLRIPTATGSILFTRDNNEYWEEQYRNLDILGEMVKLRKWAARNKSKRVPREAMYGQIMNWLKRAESRRRDDEWRANVSKDEEITWRR